MFNYKNDKYVLWCPTHQAITGYIDFTDIKACRLGHKRAGCSHHVSILKLTKKDYYETKNTRSSIGKPYKVLWTGEVSRLSDLEGVESLIRRYSPKSQYRYDQNGLVIDGYKIPDNVELFFHSRGKIDWEPRYSPLEAYRLSHQ